MDFVHPNLKLLNLNVFKALTKQKKPDKYPCRLCKPKLLILAAFDQPYSWNWLSFDNDDQNIFTCTISVSVINCYLLLIFISHSFLYGNIN